MNSPNSTSPASAHAVCFDQELIERYDGRGPRYTSYPTALQFDDGFTQDDYNRQASISNLRGTPMSIYVHIPFCEALCYYCACNKIVTRNQTRVQHYMRSLHHEIALQADLFDHDRTVEQLHFGGGTPTYLSAKQLGSLFESLRKNFTFDTSEQRQFFHRG